MKKEKLRFTQVLIKTGLVQIISVIISLYLPPVIAALLSFIMCIALGLWIFRGYDKPLIFCCFIATLMGTIPFIITRIIYLSLIPEMLPALREWTDTIIMAMAVPMMSSMYFAVAMQKQDNEDFSISKSSHTRT